MSTERPPRPFSRAVFPRIAGRSAELEREFEAARVRGYAAGHTEGVRAAAEAAALLREEDERDRAARRAEDERRVRAALAAVEAAAAALRERERELVAAGQQRLERLAVELAEAVVARELEPGAASARAALHRALSAVDEAEAREVRLHPDDLAALRQLGAVPEGLALAPDDTLARGDAVVVVADGAVDARVEAAFSRARRAVSRGPRGAAG